MIERPRVKDMSSRVVLDANDREIRGAVRVVSVVRAFGEPVELRSAQRDRLPRRHQGWRRRDGRPPRLRVRAAGRVNLDCGAVNAERHHLSGRQQDEICLERVPRRRV